MLKKSTSFLRHIHNHRTMIWVMARQELTQRYVETFGGPIWAVLQPLATVIVFWFVFAVGFKAQGPAGMPFILYFLGGYIPWLLFSETLLASATTVVANSHLVKKTIFPTEILPLSHLVASSVTHAVLLVLLLLVVLLYGRTPGLSLLQLPYYFFALSVIVLGLSWLVAALQVFIRDVGQALGIILNLWFWLTPVVWTKDMLPSRFRWVLDYNPIYYIVDGYRASFITGGWHWMDGWASLRFWCLALAFLLLGAQVFRRLKPDFADVL